MVPNSLYDGIGSAYLSGIQAVSYHPLPMMIRVDQNCRSSAISVPSEFNNSCAKLPKGRLLRYLCSELWFFPFFYSLLQSQLHPLTPH
jgi:hypothetical protein